MQVVQGVAQVTQEVEQVTQAGRRLGLALWEICEITQKLLRKEQVNTSAATCTSNRVSVIGV